MCINTYGCVSIYGNWDAANSCQFLVEFTEGDTAQVFILSGRDSSGGVSAWGCVPYTKLTPVLENTGLTDYERYTAVCKLTQQHKEV